MKNKGFLIRALLGVIILAILMYKLDFRQVLQVVSKLGIIIIVLFFVKYVFETLINALNYKILLNAVGEKIRYLTLLKYFVVSYSAGLFSPGRVGDLAIIPLLKKEGIDYGKSALISILDKTITLILLVGFSIYGFFIFLPEDNATKMSIILVIGMAIIITFLFSTKIKGMIKKHILRKYAENFKGFSKNLGILVREKKRILLLDFALTLVYIIGGACLIKLIFLIIGIDISLFTLAAISSAGRIIALIPISLSGLGVRESAFVYFYSLIGVDSATVGGVYLIAAFVYYILAGMLILLMSKAILPKNIKV